ncbi:MAG: tRNA lysidine(34) synthetase TilS [Pseudomonadota bacterium]|nr:tRNA lysidine(34) synthetase TilS [Pseudomonadota bacterium]
MRRFLETADLGGKRVAVGLSGGVDSVVLLHLLAGENLALEAIHVHHGLSPNADAWARFCRVLCKRLQVPLKVQRVKIDKGAQGLEAAAREARYAAFKKSKADVIFLAHHLDDQAETVLMNLLRGAGARGASGMAIKHHSYGKLWLRPLLDVRREAIVAHARRRGLEWIEDESNANEAYTRNFIRNRVAPLLSMKFPAWKESVSRAARHFSRRDAQAQELLRAFLRSKGLRSPSEARLLEMLKQLTAAGARTLLEHDGARLRVYRGKVLDDSRAAPARAFSPLKWSGERRLAIPALGGELRFRRARGRGIDLKNRSLVVRLRSGGERLQPDAGRPRRTLKNLFQESGVPPWERERLPLLYCGDDLVWAPGLGVDARYQASGATSGWLPEWRR